MTSAFQTRIRARDAQIVALIKQGVTPKNIAAQMPGVSERLVRLACKRAGVAMPSRRRTWTPELIARAEAMIADGIPAAEIDRTLRLRRGATSSRFPEASWSTEQTVVFQNDTGTRHRPQLRRPSFLDVAETRTKPGVPFA